MKENSHHGEFAEKEIRYLTSPDIRAVRLTGTYWQRVQTIFRDVVLEKQWQILNGEVETKEFGRSHCVDNFRIMAGDMDARYPGSYWFSDHELGKWMEAAAYGLALGAGENIREHLDYTIDLLARAQSEDGYLNSYYTLYEPGKRFTNFTTGHELLNAGNFLEAAISYYLVTGKQRFLEIITKYIDLIYDMVMSADHYIYDGHEEIEIALIKLYLLNGNKKYLRLAQRFVDTRGVGRCLFLDEDSVHIPGVGLDYYQAHLPVREQKEAVGHAVRATYLYTAMAELVAVAKDVTLLGPVYTLWNDIVERKIYITGGVGSEHHGERFTAPFDLPNDSAYAETCASIGLMMFARALLKLKPDSAVADQMEKTLYNALMSGVAVNGNEYFYVNPLFQNPRTTPYRHDLQGVQNTREEWPLCPCCPPNLARLILSLNEYLYTVDQQGIYLNLLLSNSLEMEHDGKHLSLRVQGNEPWDGHFTVAADSDINCPVYLKKPYWSETHTVMRKGKVVTCKIENGYIRLDYLQKGECVEVIFSLQTRFVYANPCVDANSGKVAVERGYLVYCAEEIDNGKYLSSISIDTYSPPQEYSVFNQQLGGEVYCVRVNGRKAAPIRTLYSFDRPKKNNLSVDLYPYYLRNNRGDGEMTVWMNADFTAI